MNGLIGRAATYFVSGLVSQGVTFCLWVSLPWLLTPAEIGYATLGLFAVELLTMLSLAGMDATIIRFAARSEFRQPALSAAVVIGGTSFAIVAALSYLVLRFDVPFIVSAQTWVAAHYLLVMAAVAANVLWTICLSFQIAVFESTKYALLQAIRSVFYLAIGIVSLMFFLRDASMLVAAMAASYVLALAIFRRRLHLSSLQGSRFTRADLNKMLRYGLPLMLVSVLGVAVNYTQRLTLDHYADVSTLGVFSYFVVIVIQLNGLWASLNRAWTPQYFALVEVDRQRSTRALHGMLGIIGIVYPLLLAAGVVVIEAVLRHTLFPATYAGQVEILYLLLLGPMFSGIYTVTYPLYYYDLNTWRIVVISAFLATVNIVSSVVLIRAAGSVGAAIAFVFLTMLTAWTYMLSYRSWIGGNQRILAMIVAISLLGGIAAGLLAVTHSPWIFAGCLVVISAIAWRLGGRFAAPLLRDIVEKTGARLRSFRAVSQFDRGAAATEDAPILFYTDIARTFRATLAGYLYQICQHRRVVVLSEKLDDDSARILADRKLFPGVVAIIDVGQYASSTEGALARYRRLNRLARMIVEAWQPCAVFAAGVNVFEHTLHRYGKQICGAVNIAAIGQLAVANARDVALLPDLHSVETNFPAWLPRSIRLLLAQMRRHAAYFIHYVAIPLLARSQPHFGINDIYRLDYTRTKGFDLTFVYTHRNKAMLVRSGMHSDKVVVIPHPMKARAADAVWQSYGIGPQARSTTTAGRQQVLLCLLDCESKFSFRRTDLSLIADEEVFASRAQVIGLLASVLAEWKIFVKPHPMALASPVYLQVKNQIESLSDRITWLAPDEPVDRHIRESSAVIGFPPVSAAIYTALMLNPGVPALIVDVIGELRGDGYVGTQGVVTVTSTQELAEQAARLASGQWTEAPYSHDAGDYETLDELITAVLRKRTPESISIHESAQKDHPAII